MAAPGLSQRYSRLSDTRDLLGSRSVEERSLLLDNPAFPVAKEIQQVVPPQGCVTVLAYAGPAAIDYYRARLGYLLYPRRVQVSADSESSAEDCGFLAVFRDSRQNLAAEPFQGNWDESQLRSRLGSLERLDGERVQLYRVP